MSLYRAIATVGGLTLVSRILGLVRDILIARGLGAGMIADAFFVALILPNTFRRLFGEGAFSTAFVPLFARILTIEGFVGARLFAEQAQTLLGAILMLFVSFAVLLMDQIIPLLVPGFADDPIKLVIAIEYARITFPYLLLISLVALLGGVLNTLDRFAAMAATPILFNLTLITVLISMEFAQSYGFFPNPVVNNYPSNYPTGAALAWGVSLSGIIQFIWMRWQTKQVNFQLTWRRPRFTAQTKKLSRLFLPALGAHGVMQINLLVGTFLASLLPTGAISSLYYADRINQLPLGVIGVATATTMLPKLTKALREEDKDVASDHFNRALEFGLLLTLPAAAALAIIALPIVDGLFYHGAFTTADLIATSSALLIYAIGLPAFVLVKILSNGFFAREDTLTPFYIGILTIAVNIIGSIILMQFFGHLGLAAATSLASWINTFLLAGILMQRGHLPLDQQFCQRIPRIILAVAGMSIILLTLEPFINSWMIHVDSREASPLILRLAGLALRVAAGGAAFTIFCLLLRAVRLEELREILYRK